MWCADEHVRVLAAGCAFLLLFSRHALQPAPHHHHHHHRARAIDHVSPLGWSCVLGKMLWGLFIFADSMLSVSVSVSVFVFVAVSDVKLSGV